MQMARAARRLFGSRSSFNAFVTHRGRARGSRLAAVAVRQLQSANRAIRTLASRRYYILPRVEAVTVPKCSRMKITSCPLVPRHACQKLYYSFRPTAGTPGGCQVAGFMPVTGSPAGRQAPHGQVAPGASATCARLCPSWRASTSNTHLFSDSLDRSYRRLQIGHDRPAGPRPRRSGCCRERAGSRLV